MDADTLARFALSLPETVKGEHRHRPAFRVGKKLFLVIQPEETEVLLFVAAEERRALVEGAPDAFEEIRDRRDRVVENWITVHLATADDGLLCDLTEDAWRRFAPKRAIAALDDRP